MMTDAEYKWTKQIHDMAVLSLSINSRLWEAEGGTATLTVDDLKQLVEGARQELLKVHLLVLVERERAKAEEVLNLK